MPKTKNGNLRELLGVTPLCQVSDEDIFYHLVPQVIKCMLGCITDVSKPVVTDAMQPSFPGDEIANLNNHKLYGKDGFVRYPYLVRRYLTQHGAVFIKRDRVKVKVYALYGDVEKGKAEIVHMAALKDRRFDGTIAANDSSLVTFPYDHVAYSKVIHPQASSLEISIYSFMPGSRVVDVTGEAEYDAFIEKPFLFAEQQPEKFLAYFERAWKANRSPGQNAAPVPNVSKTILTGFEAIARKAGYDFLESACSHYHVAMWFLASGYRYTYKYDVEIMRRLQEGLQKIEAATGSALRRPQQSWACVIQNLQPKTEIPPDLRMDGVRWPQDNLNQQSLWLNKPLSEHALKLLPGPQYLTL